MKCKITKSDVKEVEVVSKKKIEIIYEIEKYIPEKTPIVSVPKQWKGKLVRMTVVE